MQLIIFLTLIACLLDNVLILKEKMYIDHFCEPKPLLFVSCPVMPFIFPYTLEGRGTV